MPKARTAIGPLDRFGSFGNFGAESAGMRHDPDSSKIKAVGVPASLDGHVRMISFVGVAFAGTVQQPELVVVQIETRFHEVRRQTQQPVDHVQDR